MFDPVLPTTLPPRPKVDFVFFDAGGGHRAAATALQQVFAAQSIPWDIRLLDLQDILDELDIFRKLTGLRLEDIYNKILAKGWTLGSTQLLPLMHGVIRLYHPAQVRLLTRFWSENKPNLVVSLVPNFNRSMFQALRKVDPAIPYVTILTDMADYPPHFWIENQRQTFLCGTATAAEQARAIAAPGSEIHTLSGMILHPKFYDLAPLSPAERAAGRQALGLDPDRPTALVLFGGEGSAKMLEIHDRLAASSLDLQLLLLCGRNTRLADQLRARRSRLAIHVEGFTREVPRFMQLADLFIGKPGPGSVSEAIHMGLPVVVEKNAWTLPQERFNADWIVKNDLGVSLPGFSRLVPALETTLAPQRLAKLRANVGKIQNRAVFEIPGILQTILECRAPASHR